MSEQDTNPAEEHDGEATREAIAHGHPVIDLSGSTGGAADAAPNVED